MIIKNHNILFGSNYTYLKSQHKEERIRIFNNNNNAKSEKPKVSAFVDNSREIKSIENMSLNEEDKVKILLLISLFKKLTGREMYIPNFDIENNVKIEIDLSQMELQQNHSSYGIIYNFQEYLYEKETINFSAKGYIELEDGRTINLDYQIAMSREFSFSRNFEIRIGDTRKIDPIILNLDEKTISFKNETFAFDLDNDNNLENLPLFNGIFAYLAVDKNNDGKVNNGFELFGPRTGNGYKELAEYDLDKNGWIDEGDRIFKDLKLWIPDGERNNQLFTLKEKNIGAIFLGNLETKFNINNPNEVKGRVKDMGIYLKEDGGSGQILEIDIYA